jgi:hypothetical protein
MPQLPAPITPPANFTMAGTFGRIQLAATHETIILDVLGRHYGTDARLYVDHGFARLSTAQAFQLHVLLGQAILAAEAADPQPPGTWGARRVQAAGRAV